MPNKNPRPMPSSSQAPSKFTTSFSLDQFYLWCTSHILLLSCFHLHGSNQNSSSKTLLLGFPHVLIFFTLVLIHFFHKLRLWPLSTLVHIKTLTKQLWFFQNNSYNIESFPLNSFLHLLHSTSFAWYHIHSLESFTIEKCIQVIGPPPPPYTHTHTHNIVLQNLSAKPIKLTQGRNTLSICLWTFPIIGGDVTYPKSILSRFSNIAFISLALF